MSYTLVPTFRPCRMELDSTHRALVPGQGWIYAYCPHWDRATALGWATFRNAALVQAFCFGEWIAL